MGYSTDNFDPTARTNDAFDPTNNAASQERDALQQAAHTRLQEQSQKTAGLINQGTGLIGAIISGVATGNPMLGYSVGSKLGIGDAIKGTGHLEMPGMSQLQALVGQGKKKAAPGADVAPDAAAAPAAPDLSPTTDAAKEISEIW